jgi:RNA polymerase sigma-70 factor (ECF subfamily)
MTADFDDLLTGARQGDEASFVRLFRATQPALLRYLRTLGGPLADDVASDTWLSVVKGMDRFEGDEAGWRAWVFTIGRARLRDAQRRAVRTPSPMEPEGYADALPPVHDVADDVEQLYSTEAALKLIRTLPPDQAEVILLRHVAGLDVAETAQVLGKRPGTVRVTAHRGLRRLADLLRPGSESPGSESPGSGGSGVTQTRRRTVI